MAQVHRVYKGRGDITAIDRRKKMEFRPKIKKGKALSLLSFAQAMNKIVVQNGYPNLGGFGFRILLFQKWFHSQQDMDHYVSKLKIGLLTDFNGMSAHLGLFYALVLGNHVHCIFLFTVFVKFFLKRLFWKVRYTVRENK